MKILYALIVAVWSLCGGVAWGQFSVTEISILKTLTNRACANDESPVWVAVTQRWSCGPPGGAGPGSVTSVGAVGTANQITVTGSSPITSTGSWTFSIPTNPTLPGTTTGTFSGALTGNASTATALASNPTDCVAGSSYTVAIAASGNLTCEILIVSAVDDPDADDDTGDGYIIGTKWINTTDDKIFIADDVTAAAATWRQIYPAVEADTPQSVFNRIANGDVAVSGVTETKPWKYRGSGGGATYGFDIRVNSSLVPEFLPVCADVVNDCDRSYDIPTGKFYEFLINSVSIAKLESTGFTRLVPGTQAQGDILYFNGTSWVRLAPGNAGECLKSGGAAANPSWAAC